MSLDLRSGRRFIGRQSELGFLWSRYVDATDGSGSVVLLMGDPGAGKTRLTSEFATRVDASGGRALISACSEQTQASLAPILDALSKLGGKSTSAVTGPAPENTRAQFAALADTIGAFSRERTLVVILEDVHWSDVATIEFAQFFALRAAGLRIVFVLTYRQPEVVHGGLLEGALLRLLASSTTWKLSLNPLSKAEIVELIGLSHDPDVSISPSAIVRIADLAEGNPLLAEELLKHIIDAGEASALLPKSVEELALRRFAELDEQDRELLRQAAVIGRSFNAAFLAELAGVQLPAAHEALIRACDCGLIVGDPEIPNNQRFRHALIREALYSQIPDRIRRGIHARVVAALEASTVGKRLDELAYHAWAAADSVKAVDYNVRSGDEAARIFAHSNAAGFYDRALSFLQPGTHRRAEISEKLAQNLKVTGLSKRAKEVFQEIAEFAFEHGETERAADFCLDVGQQAYDAGDRDSLDWRIRGLDAIRSKPNHPLYAEALVDVAKAYSLRGDVRTAADYFAAAEPLLRNATITTRVDFLQYRGLNFALQGFAQRAMQDCNTAKSAIDPATRAPSAILAHTQLALVATIFGNLSSAMADCERGIALARQNYQTFFEAYGNILLAKIQLLAGDLGAARSSLLRGLRMAAAFDRGWMHFAATEVTILLGLALDDHDLIASYLWEDELERAFGSTDAAHIAPTCTAFAELYKARGKHEEAANLLHRGLAAVRTCGKTPWMPLTIARCGRTADLPAARKLLRDWARPGDNPAAKAYLALFDAFAAPTDSSAAKSAAAEAYRRFNDMGLKWFAGQAASLIKDQDLTSLSASEWTSAITPREVEIANLVSSGKSNRAIAETLHLSVRTVETHLTSIFSKLGFESRAELAAHVARQAQRSA